MVQGIQALDWEKLSIFLNFLVPKLPAPKEEDLARGILETIDIESYRAEKRATMQIMLEDADAEIDPVPTVGGGFRPEPELDRLSNILKTFNDLWGTNWTEADRIRIARRISEDLPAMLNEDQAFQNAKRNSDRQNARIEHDRALLRAATSLMKIDTEFFKLYMDNDSFRKAVNNTVFALTYE